MAKDTANTRYIPLSKWNDYHPWPTTLALRNMVFRKKELGFEKVIRRYGVKILIDEVEFFRWFEMQNK